MCYTTKGIPDPHAGYLPIPYLLSRARDHKHESESEQSFPLSGILYYLRLSLLHTILIDKGCQCLLPGSSCSGTTEHHRVSRRGVEGKASVESTRSVDGSLGEL